MLSVTVFCVGKLKERFFTDACEEFSKRLSGYCKLSIHEINELRAPDSSSASQIEGFLNLEGEKLLSKLSKQAFIIALCIDGEPLNSVQLSEKISKLAACGHSRLCFVIGGSNGLAESVKRAAHMRLSMSAMTFPHHLARIMLLEQIYRAFKISEGGSYHK